VTGIDSMKVLEQNLGIARGSKQMSAEEQKSLRDEMIEVAGDARRRRVRAGSARLECLRSVCPVVPPGAGQAGGDSDTLTEAQEMPKRAAGCPRPGGGSARLFASRPKSVVEFPLPRTPFMSKEYRMRKLNNARSWVVYLTPVNEGAGRAICEQNEWDRLEASRPGHFTLIRGGITNEAEAERLARGSSGDSKPRQQRLSSQEAAA